MAQGKWSEVEARGVLEAWRRSGLPLERFAKQRGFVSQRLRWWLYKFRKAEKTLAVSTPSVLPVRVAPEPARRGEPVTVLLRTGHMLKVSHGFDEAAFAVSVRRVAFLTGPDRSRRSARRRPAWRGGRERIGRSKSSAGKTAD